MVGPVQANITLITEIPRHCGFGSGTRVSLAVGSAILRYVGRHDVSDVTLARALRRGGTSGIGIHSFFKGGLVVDGGRAWPAEKDLIGPSSRFAFSDIPPCISRLKFPKWGICIAVPRLSKKVAGKREIALFRELTPIPLVEVDRTCRAVLLELLPAVASSNFENFCYALDDMQCIGFKRKERSLIGRIASQTVELMKSAGLRGVSLSSWGPAFCGFAPSVTEAAESQRILLNSGQFATVIVTKARNSGPSYDRLFLGHESSLTVKY